MRRSAVEHRAVRGRVGQALRVQGGFGRVAAGLVGRMDDEKAPLVQLLAADLAQAVAVGPERAFGVEAAESGMAVVDQGDPGHYESAGQRTVRTPLGYCWIHGEIDSSQADRSLRGWGRARPGHRVRGWGAVRRGARL